MARAMNERKVNKKCHMRGCKNTKEVYAKSRTREFGMSVIICDECIIDSYNQIENRKNGIVPPKAEPQPPKPLFYGCAGNQTKVLDVNTGEPPVTVNPLECQICGKVCVNKIGFQKHEASCKAKAEAEALKIAKIAEDEAEATKLAQEEADKVKDIDPLGDGAKPTPSDEELEAQRNAEELLKEISKGVAD